MATRLEPRLPESSHRNVPRSGLATLGLSIVLGLAWFGIGRLTETVGLVFAMSIPMGLVIFLCAGQVNYWLGGWVLGRVAGRLSLLGVPIAVLVHFGLSSLGRWSWTDPGYGGLFDHRTQALAAVCFALVGALVGAYRRERGSARVHRIRS